MRVGCPHPRKYGQMNTVTSLHQAPVDVAFLVDWALMDRHPGLQVAVDVQPDLGAQGDERRLRILFDKLFDNSRKCAQPGQPLSLRVSGECMHLQVAETGAGMMMRDAEQPFAPFMRLHGDREGGGDPCARHTACGGFCAAEVKLPGVLRLATRRFIHVTPLWLVASAVVLPVVETAERLLM